jgi:competence protein ComEC
MRLFWMGVCWLAGLVICKTLPLPVQLSLACCVLFLLATFIARKKPLHKYFPFGLAIVFAGATRYSLCVPDLQGQHVAALNDSGKRVSVSGLVIVDPDQRANYTDLIVEVESVGHPDLNISLPYRGRILIRAPRSPYLRYGQKVRAVGRIQCPEDNAGFSYRKFLARSDIYSLINSAEVQVLQTQQGNPIMHAIYSVRRHAWKTVKILFPEPEASLISGILLGIESEIPADLMEDFNNTGTSHIIVISGFNITIIAAISISVFGRLFGRIAGSFVAAFTIGIYTILVGADPAVTRAGIMGGISLLAFFIGRQPMALASLSAATIIMTLINPLSLWDIGFQLSFAATLGLVVYAQPFKLAFIRIASRLVSVRKANRFAQAVSEVVLYTLAAQITTIPLILYYFQRFPLFSVIANPLILPLQPPLMISSGMATFGGMIWIPLGKPLAWGAWLFSTLTIRIVEIIAAFPMASIHINHFGPFHLAGYYLLLVCLTLVVKQFPTRILQGIKKISPHIPVTAALGCIALAVCLVWRAVTEMPDHRNHLYILDVGEGEAILTISPEGRILLMNGGSNPLRLENELGRHLPLFHKQIDWLILNGTGEKQLAGLTGIVERYPIGQVLVCGPPGKFSYRILMEQLSEAQVPIIHAQNGQWLELDRDSQMEIIRRHDLGCIFVLHHGRFRWVTASIQDPGIFNTAGVESQLSSPTIYLLPDGGARTENPPDLLHRINPLVPVVSVGAGDPRGLPDQGLLRSLSNFDLLRTDLHGTIHVQTDGVHAWIFTER